MDRARVLADIALRCEVCDEPLTVEDWAEVTALGDRQPRFVPTRVSCPTPRCGEVCRTCRREPGDIHSGACSWAVLSKVADPCWVSIEDCR